MNHTLYGVQYGTTFFRFVSDHAATGCQALLQHRLIQASQKTQQSSGPAPETSRTYPLSLLEWTTNRKKANMALHVHCFDGKKSVSEFDDDFNRLMERL